MSRNTKAKPHDWAALQAAVREGPELASPDAAHYLRGETSKPPRWWSADYVDALQRALESRDHYELLRMLDAQIPIPPALVPVFADVLRALLDGAAVGRPAELTARDDALIRSWFDFGQAEPAVARSRGVALAELAKHFGVSEATIKRSLARTAP